MAESEAGGGLARGRAELSAASGSAIENQLGKSVMLGRGRPAVARSIGEPRELTVRDIENLERAKLPAFKVFRDSYHAVAKLIAFGLNDREVALESGYSVGRIVQLKADPSMQAAIEAYRHADGDGFRQARDEYYRTVVANRNLAARRINDRLTDEDEVIPLKDLVAIEGSAADRTGYGKVVTKKVTVDLADRLAQALAASAKVVSSRPKIIDHEETQ